MNNELLNVNNINNQDKDNENHNQKGNSIIEQQNGKEIEKKTDLEKTLISSMRIEITRINEQLSQSQSKINDLFQENNKLKLLQLENSKKLSVKEDIINSNKIEINRLQSKNKVLESENESNRKLIQELNDMNIELNQKIKSFESINKTNQIIKENKSDSEYLSQINELYNKINEIEIKNSKLMFNNKNLENKIEIIKNDNKNEIDMIELLYKKKIEKLEKNILNLNKTINELINESKKQPKEKNNYQIQNEMYKNFFELEQKIRKYELYNFNCIKENQILKNENEQLKINIKGKETIINKLQKELKIKMSEKNIKSPNNQNNNNEIVNNNINDLLNDKKRLIEENEILKTNYEQMTLGINEANELFINKQNEYENIINVQNEKLKEYKFKISLLKIKINELHTEIDSLKDNQIKTENNFYQNFNNDLFSTIEKDNSIDFNFTPEQIKLSNSCNSPIKK